MPTLPSAATAPALPEQRGANVMGYSDNPFSITSKFNVPGGAEHLVTIRGANASDFKAHLHEADVIFPEAKFLSWTMVPEADRGNWVPAVAPYADQVSEDPAVEAAMVVPPDVEGQREETVARLKAKAKAQTVQAQSVLAHAEACVANHKANGNGNGNSEGQPVTQDKPHNQGDPLCPAHGRSSRSKFDGGLYCPTKLQDGTYCKWHCLPGPVPASVN